MSRACAPGRRADELGWDLGAAATRHATAPKGARPHQCEKLKWHDAEQVVDALEKLATEGGANSVTSAGSPADHREAGWRLQRDTARTSGGR